MFTTRLLSGCVLIFIMAVLTMLGGNCFGIAVFAISCIGLFELYRVAGLEKCLIAWIGYLAVGVYYLMQWLGRFSDQMLVPTFFVLLWMSVYVISFPKYKMQEIFLVSFGLLYVPVLFSYLWRVRMLENGIFWIGLIFVGAWGCDTCAYCTGRLLGKHKLAPVLSPKKTIEGSVGGVVGAGILGMVYAVVLGKWVVMPKMEADYYGVAEPPVR